MNPTVHRLHAARGAVVMEARELSVRYRRRGGDNVAFSGVNLPVHAGRVTALVGPSGCGKTSLLSSFNRMTDLIEGCRVEGELTVFGESVLGRGVDVVKLRRRVGMIFQKPNPFPLSIAKNLTFPLKEHGVRDRAERRARTQRALEDVGLWDEVKDRLKESALSLSGGQMQRLCIARALVLEPEVLLLDEPCSALDPISSARVEELMLGLRERYTMVVVTHNLAQARRIADYVGMFWVHEGAGRLVELGETAQIFDDPEHELTKAYVAGARG
jgi:phosphate transport system ATP-binding protein